MKIAISQPTFLPWPGYFALINYVDEFVFLDNTQFAKRSWQQRNYIKLNEDKYLVTIPVISKNKFNQKINQVQIDYNNFQVSKFLKTIELAYKKSPYFSSYFEIFKKILNKKNKYLSELNLDVIINICNILKINDKFTKASIIDLDTNLTNVSQLDMICKKRSSNHYISTLGAKEYLKDLKIMPLSKAKITYFNYEIKDYSQLGKHFVPNLSILDLLFNEGPNTLNIIKKNFFILKN